MKLLVLTLALLATASAAAPPDAPVDVTIALSQRNLDVLETTLLDVSDVNSPNYGKYLSVYDLGHMIGVSEEEFAAVEKWAFEMGALGPLELLPSRDYARARFPWSVAKQLTASHTRQASYPSNVEFVFLTASDNIDVRMEGSKPLPRSHAREIGEAYVRKFGDASYSPSSSSYMGIPIGAPNAQKAVYGMPVDLVGNNSANVHMVWGPGTFGSLPTDMSKFYKEHNVPTTADLLTYDGYANRSSSGDNFDEGTLDTTYISSMGSGIETIILNTDNGSSTEEGLGFGPAFLNFMTNLTAGGHWSPNVVSMSLGSLSWQSCNLLCVQVEAMNVSTYAECEAYMSEQRQVCMYDSAEEVDRINTELMKGGTMGITFIAATGDGGSHFSFMRFPLHDPIGEALNTVSCNLNFPTFPSASPWVTGVGGTQWNDGGTPEKAVAWVASGSGFSWEYPRQSYQETDVSNYLANTAGLPPSNAYNASNRGYPDVAAMAAGVPVVVDGENTVFGGTSASTPAFAGIISMVNDLRLNAGLPSLGFLNPRIYSMNAAHPGELFYDMSYGNSNCDSSGFCCSTGFPAAVGWDPTTGLGSPIWSGFVDYLASAP